MSREPFALPPDFYYKGYTGHVHTINVHLAAGDPRAERDYTFRGHVIGIRDMITFVGVGTEAAVEADAVQAFHGSVDDYIAWCAELGRPPEKPVTSPASG